MQSVAGDHRGDAGLEGGGGPRVWTGSRTPHRVKWVTRVKDIDADNGNEREELNLCEGRPCPREDENEDDGVSDARFTIDLGERERWLI